jgi:CRISPR-associated endonuclease/helicase Cas3
MSTKQEPAAHIDQGRIHLLEDHLREVGRLAASFAEKFGSSEWGRLAGLWHDGGKYRAAFQRMILEANGMTAHLEDDQVQGRVTHSTAGALLARERFQNRGLALQLVIAGHHAGLSDPFTLEDRLNNKHPRELEEARNGGWSPAPEPCPEPPPHLAPRGVGQQDELRRDFELWVRMLFSALVDADFLDTERFYDQSRSELRRQGSCSLQELSDRLDAHLEKLQQKAGDSPVQAVRARVLRRAQEAARQPQGAFSLTVPTGGGKTLTSLSFALRHAVAHGLERVIVAIPYTSIIEQTAEVYRAILGDAVVEHHSALDPSRETPFNRIASENWDAPVVVTTNVQLFESLFANRSSRCRKLHRLVRSVVVLDEAQTLPLDFLIPILDVLRGLLQHYRVSLLLSTATQPALSRREDRRWGLPDVREIVDDPGKLASELRRVTFELPEDLARETTWAELAARVHAHDRVLAITHQRKHARVLFEEVLRLRGEEATFHLSALMCAEHRAEVLGEIRRRLAGGGPLCVISTQLVEAGVDLDFPVVFRALGGLDAITQAAGRCNREGNLATPGRVILFRAPDPPPPGPLQQGLDAMLLMLRGNPALDPLSPSAIEEYFQRLYRVGVEDRHGVQPLRAERKFREVAEKVRLIDEEGRVDLVVPHGDLAPIERLRAWPSRVTFRGVQRKIVGIPRHTAEAWQRQGVVDDVGGLLILSPVYAHLYDRRLGLKVEANPVSDPAQLVI